MPVEDKRGSWYSICPKAIFSAVVGLSAGAGAVSGNASQFAAEAAFTAPAIATLQSKAQYRLQLYDMPPAR